MINPKSIFYLQAKLHNDDKKGWMLCLMLPNDYKEKSGEMKSFPPSVICIAASDLKELLAVLQGLLLEILTNGQDQILPRIANHVHGGETNSKKEEFWSPGIISSLGSGSIMLRPWRAGSTNFVKLLSPRPPSPEYEWLGVQMTLYLEEAMSLCSHLQEFMKELLMNGVSV